MRFILFSFLFLSFYSFGQVPRITESLIGEWKFKAGTGLERWKLIGDELKGEEIRINKLGDSIVVEEMTIRSVNNHLIYVVEEHKVGNNSIVQHHANHFVSRNTKMNFYNIDSNVPSFISYRFGFLNRNRVKIKISFNENEKPVKLLMFRKKE